ncbi:hypothetical protein MMC06_003827 [Schaereria dolodes]|nr:hypothetical protein [Schaereria dolodes]
MLIPNDPSHSYHDLRVNAFTAELERSRIANRPSSTHPTVAPDTLNVRSAPIPIPGVAEQRLALAIFQRDLHEAGFMYLGAQPPHETPLPIDLVDYKVRKRAMTNRTQENDQAKVTNESMTVNMGDPVAEAENGFEQSKNDSEEKVEKAEVGEISKAIIKQRLHKGLKAL